MLPHTWWSTLPTHTQGAHQKRYLSFKGLEQILEISPPCTSFMHAHHLIHLHLHQPDALGSTVVNSKSATFTIYIKYIGVHYNLGNACATVVPTYSTYGQSKVVKQCWVTTKFGCLQFRMHRYPLLHSNGWFPGVPRAQEERKTITIPTSSNCPCNSSIVFWCSKIHGESP